MSLKDIDKTMFGYYNIFMLFQQCIYKEKKNE